MELMGVELIALDATEDAVLSGIVSQFGTELVDEDELFGAEEALLDDLVNEGVGFDSALDELDLVVNVG